MTSSASSMTSQVKAKVPGITISPTATTNSSSTATPTSKSSNDFCSIVDKVFGGKMQTTYQCCNCKHVSKHSEGFTDLNLAFPDLVTSKDDEVTASTSTAASAEDSTPDEEGSASGEVNSDPVTPTKSSIEGSVSNKIEDLGQGDLGKKKLTMQDLLDNYLRAEKLEGENKYRCDKCESLQDAVKQTLVTETPSHLMCTLMRFNYDRALSRKSKVCTDIKYELSLNLPQHSDGEAEDHTYSLYAIVVHSGYSSDGGHYYTYARVLNDVTKKSNEKPADVIGNKDADLWYIFNDSKVSFTTFESFVKLSERFPVDTAYVLFYQRNGLANSDQSKTSSLPLRMDLNMAVERDNIKFMREKEKSAGNSNSSSSSSASSAFRRPSRGDDQDEDDDGGPPTSGGCGNGNAFNAPGRFVC